MKLSRYNFLYENIPGTDKAVIYNSRTGALAALESDNYVSFKDFSNKGLPIKDSEFEKQLRHCGYIVEDDFDEIKQIKLNLLTNRYNTSNMRITIAPTMDCNFRCTYCYEKGYNHAQVISDEIIDKIVEIVRSRARSLASLHVLWFGGEPLLAMSQLEGASKKLMDVCKEFNVDYSSSIITNGYLLTADIVERLKGCKVESAQVTIDGTKDIHDKRRPLSDGTGTFDEIINNLSSGSSNLSVMLRINVDRENEKCLSDVVEILKERNLMEHIYPYAGHVVPYNEQYESSKCLSLEDYSRVSLQFMLDNNISLANARPKQRGNYCTADYDASLIRSAGEYL